ncbi:nitrous oxide reductase accessory protein NosL [Bacillus sp. JJ1503]|uniref:nitrous oxide reductase accessory protein NosL n=1 Tax=Bacillus sp. JJ1503 TaxID=3122956 RepID=UPI002FFD621B
MKCRWWVLLLAVMISLTACSNKTAAPVEIKANEEDCDACHMGIEDLHSAAQIILEDGEPKLFDDIGCMVVYMQEHQPKYEAAFVHDFDSEEWISFDNSTFVQNQNIHSPMNYGIAAYETEQQASDMQKEQGGEIYSSKELLEKDLKGTKHGH